MGKLTSLAISIRDDHLEKKLGLLSERGQEAPNSMFTFEYASTAISQTQTDRKFGEEFKGALVASKYTEINPDESAQQIHDRKKKSICRGCGMDGH